MCAASSKMDLLLEEFECPICRNYLTIPIKQCATGHSICEKCMSRLDNCSLCRGQFTEGRNYTLEKMALKLEYPCIYKNAGCRKLSSYHDKDKHELECIFKGFKCARKDCDFLGDSKSLKGHWMSRIPKHTLLRPNHMIYFALKNDIHSVNLVESFGELFWYKVKSANDFIFFTVQYIGNREYAKRYSFEVEIMSMETRRKHILADHCKGINESDTESFKDDSCFSIEFRTLKTLLSFGSKLNTRLKLFQHCFPKQYQKGVSKTEKTPTPKSKNNLD